MVTEELINNANEKVKSLYSENKRLWFCIYVLIIVLACVSIVFGIISLYFFLSKVKIQYRI